MLWINTSKFIGWKALIHEEKQENRDTKRLCFHYVILFHTGGLFASIKEKLELTLPENFNQPPPRFLTRPGLCIFNLKWQKYTLRGIIVPHILSNIFKFLDKNMVMQIGTVTLYIISTLCKIACMKIYAKSQNCVT